MYIYTPVSSCVCVNRGSFCRFLDSAEALLKEAGGSIARYQVCDNIDLSTILQVSVFSLLLETINQRLRGHMQEYESYYFVKFKKTPKITKRAASNSRTFCILYVRCYFLCMSAPLNYRK